MEATNRESDDALIERLATVARHYDVFQLLCVLEQHYGTGLFEQINVKPDSHLTFPVSDVVAIKVGATQATSIIVSLYGLYGNNSPLADYLLQAMLSTEEPGAQWQRWCDTFHRHYYQLLFLGWKKFRPWLTSQPKASAAYRLLTTLAGQHPRPNTMLPWQATALTMSVFDPRARLHKLIQALLPDVAIRIEEFIGIWTQLSHQAHLSSMVAKLQLGCNSLLGRQIFQATTQVCVFLGPVTQIAYQRLQDARALIQLCQGLADSPCEGICLQLFIGIQLSKARIPCLGRERLTLMRLGQSDQVVTVWLKLPVSVDSLGVRHR